MHPSILGGDYGLYSTNLSLYEMDRARFHLRVRPITERATECMRQMTNMKDSPSLVPLLVGLIFPTYVD